MPNEKDINAPIKILLLGSDTNIGEELLSFAAELNEFSLTSLTQENFYQTQFSVNSFEHYDVVLDALSVGADSGDYAQIKACNMMLQEADVSMFMLSSVEVFSGDKGAAYDENEVPDAKTAKGKQLAEIEQQVLKDDNSIVLRSGWLFGCKQQDFVASILAKLKLGEPVLLEDDLLGNPTPVSDLVRVAFSLIKQRHFGAKMRVFITTLALKILVGLALVKLF